MPKEKESGFTLIELLIVIIIISILVTLLAVSYTQIQRSARDKQRTSDLATVAGALERFYSDNSVYPSSHNGRIAYENDCSPGTANRQDWGQEGVECNGVNYIRQLPADPINSNNQYCYRVVGGSNNQQYQLYARLEGSGGNISPTNCNGRSGYNYRLTSNS